MTDPETPAHDSYDASILEVLAGLDPPKPRPWAFTTLDDASDISALNDAYAQGRITVDEMAALLAQLKCQDLA
jgi:hypothetical protein